MTMTLQKTNKTPPSGLPIGIHSKEGVPKRSKRKILLFFWLKNLENFKLKWFCTTLLKYKIGICQSWFQIVLCCFHNLCTWNCKNALKHLQKRYNSFAEVIFPTMVKLYMAIISFFKWDFFFLWCGFILPIIKAKRYTVLLFKCQKKKLQTKTIYILQIGYFLLFQFLP